MTARPPFAALRGRTPEDCFGRLATPCYILDEAALRQNGEILKGVADRTGAKLLLAQKAFSNYDCYPALAPYLAGTEASGLFEARLGWEILPEKEVHVFCGAYRDDEFDELLRYADHVVFNSPAQLSRLGPRAKAAGKSLGLRINPECSTQEGHAIYDPCAPGSRLGTTREQWDAKMTPELVGLLDGLHFHTLCEQDSDALEITLDAVAEKFGDVLPRMKWLNMGGGHHVTRPDYDIPRLERCIRFAQQTWGVTVYLEPGEAWALNAGFLASRVLDVTENGSVKNAILDCSAACHMPDVIEMPYMPPLYGAAEGSGIKDQGSGDDNSNIYRLGGPTCLSGDVIGDYEFDHALQIGELVLFGDLAIYSTCKNNAFNGMPLPNIWYRRADGSLEQLTDFGYRDFKYRLGRAEKK
ncbi:MAG: carboxynorspermidine decarboxylase [Oscillospiraceae bacterium]|nr:carboxynorspermidine decarboxylase [Oscillospiraceae bacterium]